MRIQEGAPALVVLAAGMGSRYGGLKQMDAFGPNGETILDYSIYDAIKAGFGKVVFVIRKSFEVEFRTFFSNKFEDLIQISYVFQELEDVPQGVQIPEDRTKPWGTAHAVWVARDEIQSAFVVINADDFYGRDAYDTCIRFLNTQQDMAYGLVAYKLRQTMSKYGTVNRGVCSIDQENNLAGIEETLKIGFDQEGRIFNTSDEGVVTYFDPDTPVSMNLWIFHKDYFPFCEAAFISFMAKHGHEPKSEFFIPLLIENLISTDAKKVKILTCDESWFGVTYQKDKPFVMKRLRALISEGKYPIDLWNTKENTL